MFPIPIISQYGNVLPSTDVIKKVQSHLDTVMVLSSTGNLYGIGLNSEGQLGTGSTDTVSSWTLVNTNVLDFWCSHTNVTVINKNDGTWFSTGKQRPFNGSSTNDVQFVDRTSFFGTILADSGTIKSVSISDYSVLCTTVDGSVYRSGYNLYGQLFTGNTTSISTLTKSTEVNVQKALTDESGFNSYVLYNDGTLKGAGNNTYSQLNDSSTTSKTSLQTISTEVLNYWVGPQALFVLKSDGLYSAGRNSSGQLGTGTSNSTANMLAKVSSLIPVDMVSTQGLSHFYVQDGTVYGTGANQYGIGTGSSDTIITSFTEVPDFKGYVELSHGQNRSYVIKNQRLYACGLYNSTYNVLPDYTSTVQVLSALNVKGIV